MILPGIDDARGRWPCWPRAWRQVKLTVRCEVEVENSLNASPAGGFDAATAEDLGDDTMGVVGCVVSPASVATRAFPPFFMISLSYSSLLPSFPPFPPLCTRPFFLSFFFICVRLA